MKKARPIDLALALRVVKKLADADDVELVLPGDVRREVVLYAMAAAHGLSGTGWSLDYARQNVSVTLPGAGAGVDLLAAIPVAGPILAKVAEGLRRPAIYLAPSVLGNGVTLLGTYQHERGHVGSIRVGNLGWCVAYGVVPEARAGAEAPCYGVSMAHQVRLGGTDVDKAEADALASLSHYGLDDAAMKLARALVKSNGETLRGGGDPGDVVTETLSALRAAGWTG